MYIYSAKTLICDKCLFNQRKPSYSGKSFICDECSFIRWKPTYSAKRLICNVCPFIRQKPSYVIMSIYSVKPYLLGESPHMQGKLYLFGESPHIRQMSWTSTYSMKALICDKCPFIWWKLTRLMKAFICTIVHIFGEMPTYLPKHAHDL